MKIYNYLTLLLLAGLAAPAAKAQFTGKPQYLISTRRAGVPLGNIKVELFPLIAPLHVKNFDSLVSRQFYDSTAFHRVVPGFVIQGGVPNSRHGARYTWGQGNSSQPPVPAEFNPVSHVRGTLSAARDTGINSANSQFFICVGSPTYLNGQYCAYGHVIAGMNYADTIVNAPRDANDNPYQKIDMFVTYLGSNDSIPGTPTLIAPASGVTNVSPTLTFSWTKVNSAQVYRIQLSKDSTFATVYSVTEVLNPMYTLTSMEALSTFYWRVCANNGGQLSPYSAIRKFSTASGAATLISPADNMLNVSLNTTLSWNTVQGATSYRLQVSKLSSSFNPAALVFNQAGLTDTVQAITGLTPKTKYYWRIRSAIDTAEGFYSARRSFFTGITAAVAEVPRSNNTLALAQNVPNPATGKTTVEYTLPEPVHVNLKLYDILGKEVMVITNELKSAGTHTQVLDLSRLSPGIYFYKLQTGDKNIAKRMMVY